MPYTLSGVMSDGKVNEGVDDKDASMTSQHSSEDLFAEEYNTIDPNVTRYFLKILLCKSFSVGTALKCLKSDLFPTYQ